MSRKLPRFYKPKLNYELQNKQCQIFDARHLSANLVGDLSSLANLMAVHLIGLASGMLYGKYWRKKI